MPVVCGIKFRGTGKVYYFSPGSVQDLVVDDYVIVGTVRGKELGRVAMPQRHVSDAEIVGELKPILRRATTADLVDWRHSRRQEAEAIAECQKQVATLHLPMKVVSAEYNYDGGRLTFFFRSERRVDFRELVRELARIFKTRIELRQIGVRDEAKIVGGMGKCGRPICCATWLTGFCPVSIRMAKQQDLPLSPMEISGLCGRLLCCLGYENQYYEEVKDRLPKAGKTIATPYGVGKVVRVSVLAETVNVLLEDGTTVELTADEVAGKAQAMPDLKAHVSRGSQQRSHNAGARRLAPRGYPSHIARVPARAAEATDITSSEPRSSRHRRGSDKAQAVKSRDQAAQSASHSRRGRPAPEKAPTKQPGESRRARALSKQKARRGSKRAQRKRSGE